MLHEELDIVFGSAGGHAGHSTPESPTIVLTITVSASTSPSLAGVANTPNPTTTDLASPVTEGGATRPDLQSSREVTQVTANYHPLSSPIKSDSPGRLAIAEMSRDTLRRAEETVDTMKTWKTAVNVIKRVMDTVSPIAAVCPASFLSVRPELTCRCSVEPLCKSIWSMLSKIPEVCWLVFSEDTEYSLFLVRLFPQTLLRQVERDDNIQTLLKAIRDSFEFSEEAGTLRDIKPESRQATILEDMLKCVSECAEFIRSYAEDVTVGTSRTLLSRWSL